MGIGIGIVKNVMQEERLLVIPILVLEH
jgi:hypothetical protein